MLWSSLVDDLIRRLAYGAINGVVEGKLSKSKILHPKKNLVRARYRSHFFGMSLQRHLMISAILTVSLGMERSYNTINQSQTSAARSSKNDLGT